MRPLDNRHTLPPRWPCSVARSVQKVYDKACVCVCVVGALFFFFSFSPVSAAGVGAPNGL